MSSKHNITNGRKDYSDAVAIVLADSDSLIDWISGECLHQHGTQWPRIAEATAEDFAHVPVFKLVSLMFDPGQPAGVTQAARDAIANRYLDDTQVRIRVAQIAHRQQLQSEEDERQDRAELKAQFDRVMGHPVQQFPTLNREPA